MTKQTKILTGLLAGAALGATIALVIAAPKNDELKEKINDWLCDLLASSKDKMSIVGNLVKDNLARIKA
ncbi:MAG: YtxH domain-containing protein [Bacteroidota bacterium]